MSKTSTRDAALSRLFGSSDKDDEGEVSSAEEPPDAVVAPPTKSTDKKAANEARKKKPPPSKVKTIRSEKEPRPEEIETDSAVGKEQKTGYLGLGRYGRGDGIMERITPYVRPDQAEALRIAVARKRDPRGKDMSQIVQALLDEAGYRDQDE